MKATATDIVVYSVIGVFAIGATAFGVNQLIQLKKREKVIEGVLKDTEAPKTSPSQPINQFFSGFCMADGVTDCKSVVY